MQPNPEVSSDPTSLYSIPPTLIGKCRKFATFNYFCPTILNEQQVASPKEKSAPKLVTNATIVFICGRSHLPSIILEVDLANDDTVVSTMAMGRLRLGTHFT